VGRRGSSPAVRHPSLFAGLKSGLPDRGECRRAAPLCQHPEISSASPEVPDADLPGEAEAPDDGNGDEMPPDAIGEDAAWDEGDPADARVDGCGSAICPCPLAVGTDFHLDGIPTYPYEPLDIDVEAFVTALVADEEGHITVSLEYGSQAHELSITSTPPLDFDPESFEPMTVRFVYRDLAAGVIIDKWFAIFIPGGPEGESLLLGGFSLEWLGVIDGVREAETAFFRPLHLRMVEGMCETEHFPENVCRTDGWRAALDVVHGTETERVFDKGRELVGVGNSYDVVLSQCRKWHDIEEPWCFDVPVYCFQGLLSLFPTLAP
jgi:hypothetical protein